MDPVKQTFLTQGDFYETFQLQKLSMLIAGFTLVTSPALAEISLRFGYEAPRSDSQHSAAKNLMIF